MIDRLVANGWVERRTAPDDRRVKRVYLTADAERVHKRIWRVAGRRSMTRWPILRLGSASS